MRTDPRTALFAAFFCAAASACGDVGPTAEITARRTASRPSNEVVPGATPRERFAQRAPPEDASDDLAIDYALPEGWKVLARTRDRFVNLQPAGDPDSVCYLSALPGSAGGLAANVNRWRGQLDAEPLTGEEVAALPDAQLMGGEGKLVEVAGTYGGMSGEVSQPDFALLGIIITGDQFSVFLKLVAPAAIAQAERERFLELARSMRVLPGASDGHEHSEGDGHDHSDEESTTAGPAPGLPSGHPPVDRAAGGFTPRAAGGAPLAWTTPAGWEQDAARPMRELSFALPGGAECYVTRLEADAGGLRANLDRWRAQIGLQPLDDAAFAALERVAALGERVPLLEAYGTFSGMDGVERAGQGLLGVALIRDHDSLFVKLTGPEEVVRAERASFLAFLASLEEQS